MEATVRFAEIIIKTGKLFAESDGFFDEREKVFIDKFVKTLKNESIIDSKTSDELSFNVMTPNSFESLINDTKLFLSEFNDFEKNKITDIIHSFIIELISVDGVVSEHEKTLLVKWEHEIGIK